MSAGEKPDLVEVPGGPGTRSPAARMGRGFLLGTLVATGIGFITVLALSYATPAMQKIENAPPPADWAQKMERIGVCLVYYAAKNGGSLPDKLSTLLKQGYLKELKAFDASDMPGLVEKEEEIDLGADFIYLLKGGTLSDGPQAALRQNIPGGRTLFISKKGLSWDTASQPEPAKN